MALMTSLIAVPSRLMGVEPSERWLQAGTRLVWLTAFLILPVGFFTLAFVDVPVAAYFETRPVPEFLDKLLDAAEHYGTFYGEIMILGVLACLWEGDRRKLLRVCCMAWASGLSANLLKLLVARTRPKYFDFTTATDAQGFVGLFDFAAGGSRLQSFPSAHTATAVGLTFAFAHFFPKGRWAFFLLAAMVGFERLASQSHFVSDVLAGALVGWFISSQFIGQTSLARRFDRFEAAE
jgi:membrane-associated phospholipid phosphatase